MKQLSTEKTMTVREIMELTKLSRNNVLRVIRQQYPGLMKKGKKTKLNRTQSENVVCVLRKTGLISPIQNGEGPSQNAEVSVITDIKLLSVSISQMAESMNNLAAGIAGQVEFQNNRIRLLENKFQKRIDALPAPQISTRNEINRIVREEVEKTGADYRDVWHLLYNDFGYRMNRNYGKCAKNRSMKTIDYIEQEGILGELLATARELFTEN